MSKPEKPPPLCTDTQGWLDAIKNGDLDSMKPEVLVAAAQDMGPTANSAVLNPLLKHLSDLVMKTLRKFVYHTQPNHGDDIVERVHGKIWECFFNSKNGDGKHLRTAFFSVLRNRVIDAVRSEESARCKGGIGKGGDADGASISDESLDSSWIEKQQNSEVEDVLRLIPDPKKRMAFRLFVEGVPIKSKKGESIAAAVGVSERWVRVWIAEVQAFLKTKLGDTYEK